jgi:hypothetical protein
MTLIEHPWHLWGQELLHMKHQAEEELWHPWARWLVHWTSIRTSQMLYGLHHKNKIKHNSENSLVFSTKIILPFPSSHDLVTQAAADLTHALLHPQPAGPFYQVGDEQAITLKR